MAGTGPQHPADDRTAHAARGLWVPSGKDFFCFEPTSHATDGLNARSGHPAGEHFVVLEPGQAFEQRITFSVVPSAGRRQ